jgi:predicted permease
VSPTPRRLYDILRLRVRSLFAKTAVERELDQELQFHLDRQIEENLARGMTPEAARSAALQLIGGIAQVKEDCRDHRRTQQLETSWRDLRYALRTLRRAPGFAAIIIVTLALAIGANSAIFSVIEGVLLRPLPFAQPDRLVRVYFSSETQPKFPLNPNDFLDLRNRARTFASLAALNRHDAQLSGAGDPVMLRRFNVSAGYFQLLGISPALGREFTFDDELPGHGRLAILSDRMWRTRFKADPDILGRSITLDAQAFTIVGIMPPEARHPGNNFHAVADGDTVDLWSPYTFDDNPRERGSHFMDVIGRLRPGVTPAQGNADLTAVLTQLQQQSITGKGWHVYLVPLYQELVGRTQRMLFVLLGAVGLLLLIACVNAANLLLARSSARVREIAVRSALGARRTRIIRQLLTESLVIAVAGAALGTLLAVGGVRLLVASLPPNFPRASEIHLDAGVFAFTLVAAMLTGLLFGLVPALTASRMDLVQTLREGGRGSTGSGRQLQLRNLLVAGETALACVLLIGAGLLLHSFVNLLRTDPGFRPGRVLTASITLPRERYPEQAQVTRTWQRLVDDIAAISGVEAAGIGSDIPWTGYDGNADGFLIEKAAPSFTGGTTARYHVASADYFATLGIPLLRGRTFTSHDTAASPIVIVINEAMARRYWAGEEAIGKRISFRGMPAEKDWMTVIGIVADVKDTPDGGPARPALWFPHAQQPDRSMSVTLRASASASASAGASDERGTAALLEQLRHVVQRIDPNLAIGDVRVMNQIVDAAVSGQRFSLFLVGLFAALALVLATIGIYGVMAYAVSQRMHEFSLRVALGASPGTLVRLIVGQGLRVAIAGAVIGLIGAALLARLLGSLLFEVSAADPLTFAGVTLLAVITALCACYLPARRAGRADPMDSLRAD